MKKMIVVIDNSLFVQDIIRHILEENGYGVVSVTEIEAIRHYTVLNHSVSAFLLGDLDEKDAEELKDLASWLVQKNKPVFWLSSRVTIPSGTIPVLKGQGKFIYRLLEALANVGV